MVSQKYLFQEISFPSFLWNKWHLLRPVWCENQEILQAADSGSSLQNQTNRTVISVWQCELPVLVVLSLCLCIQQKCTRETFFLYIFHSIYMVKSILFLNIFTAVFIVVDIGNWLKFGHSVKLAACSLKHSEEKTSLIRVEPFSIYFCLQWTEIIQRWPWLEGWKGGPCKEQQLGLEGAVLQAT